MAGVTVIIPTYNRAGSIGAAIESVLGQSYGDYEIIVVDDGSTDDTPDRVGRYRSVIRYLRKSNGGAASARNEGLRHARGRYIAWLDSDDEWLPFKLELQMQAFRQFPDVRLVFSDFSALDEDETLTYSYGMDYFRSYGRYGRELSRIYEGRETIACDVTVHGRPVSTFGVYHGRIYESMIWGNLIGTPTVVFERGLVDECGMLDQSLGVYEDYEFHLRLCRVARVGYVDLPTMVYRSARSDRLTYDGDLASLVRQRETLLRVLERVVVDDPEVCRRHPHWWAECAGRCHAKLSTYLAVADRRKARTHWWKALRLSRRVALSPKTAARVWLPKPLVRGLQTVSRGLFPDRAAYLRDKTPLGRRTA